MSWNYNRGSFYVNEAGDCIWYIEQNPCRCCPDDLLVERRKATSNKNVRFTAVLAPVKGFPSIFKDLTSFVKGHKLRELK